MAGKVAGEMVDIPGGNFGSAGAWGVLVADPDPSLTTVLQLPLQKAGFRVRTAGTAEDALRALQKEPVAAVVLDPFLLAGPGHALTQQLSRDARKGRPKFALVIMSTLEAQDALHACGLAGDRFLAKPFDPWDLVRILRELLRQA